MSFFGIHQLTAVMAVAVTSIAGCSFGGGFGLASLQEPVSYKPRTENTSQTSAQVQSHPVPSSTSTGPTSIRPSEYLQVADNKPTDTRTVAANPVQMREAQFEPGLRTLGPNDNLGDLINNAQGVVLVDFYADWCGPCRTQGGILHDLEPLARRNGALIVKINVDQRRDLAERFQVSSLPTLILIKNGQVVHRQSGLADERQVSSMLVR